MNAKREFKLCKRLWKKVKMVSQLFVLFPCHLLNEQFTNTNISGGSRPKEICSNLAKNVIGSCS